MRKLLILLSLACLFPASAFAQAITPVGSITHLWVAGGQNYGFRLYLSNNGTDPLAQAGCTYGFAYLNTTHDNYQTVVATLLSSYYQGKKVTLHASKESSGFCRIDEIEG